MPTDSTRLGFAQPLGPDPVTGLRAAIDDLIATLDPVAVIGDRGPRASQPAPSSTHAGKRIFVVSDEGNQVELDVGSAWVVLVKGTDTRLTKRPSHTFTMLEDQALPVAGKTIGRFYAPAGTIIKARHSCLSGTGEVKLQKGGVDISGLDDLDLSTTATTETPSGTPTTAEEDEIRLVSKTQGTAKGTSVSVYMDV